MNNIALKYGIIGGVGVVAYFLVFYFIRPQLMLEPGVMWGSTLVYLTFMFLAARQARNMQGDVATFTFKQALRTAFLTFVIISLFYYIFTFVLYRLDPTMIIYEKEVALRTTRWLADLMNQEFSDDEWQKFRAENRPITLGNALFGFAQSLIRGFILALPVAAVVRR
ncbi:MAG: DUF4199 domain-containing protein [Saprospiraceae bacterium]